MTLISEAPAAPATYLVPLEKLEDSPLNPRKDPKPEELEELRASIRQRGILVPLLVRPLDGTGLEVLAGKRRLAAARLEGLEEVPVHVRQVDDETARELALEEQLQREDLDPFEEAAALAELLKRRSATEVGEAIGKAPRWVARRANLAKLSKRWRKAATDGPAAEYSDRHLELVALLEPADQDRLLESWQAWELKEGLELETLRDRVAGYTHRLRAAPWSIEDAELEPKAGACATCPDNTGNARDLFGDWIPEGAKEAEAACRRPSCWAKKRTAWRDAQLAKARKKHGSELLLVDDHQGRRGRDSALEVGKPKNAGEIAEAWNLQRCKKSTPGARPCLNVTGPSAGGTVYWAKPYNTGRGGTAKKATKKKAEKKAAPLTKARAAKELEAKRVQLAARRRAWVVEHVREELGKIRANLEGRELDGHGAEARLAKKAPPLVRPVPEPPVLLLLAGAYGCAPPLSYGESYLEVVTMPQELVLEALYTGVLSKVLGSLLRAGPGDRREEQYSEAGWLALELLGRQPAELDAAAAEKIPEPKSWANLEAIAKGEKQPPAPRPSSSKAKKSKKAKAKKAKATKRTRASSAAAPRRKKATKRKRRKVTT